MKVLSVVGARPNFMKVAPLISAIGDHNRIASQEAFAPDLIQHILVHTGQHYDRLMSDSFFEDLNLPAPDVHLGVGSGSHAVQTAEIMSKFEAVLLQEKPDILVVVGDVNSTVACALVASKISFDAAGRRPLIAHVEAGLRSYDRNMPEEVNRIVTDHLSDLLFVSEESGIKNLAHEGVPAERVYFVGNTMIDSLVAYKRRSESSEILTSLGLHGRSKQYALLTLHRPANVDNEDGFSNILEGLRELAAEYPVIFPAHPRTQKNIASLKLHAYFEFHNGETTNNCSPDPKCDVINVVNPLGYIDFVHLMDNAAIVITDSGGIQEETTCLGVPCVTVRENTERPVTISNGTNVLAGTKKDGIRKAIRQQLNLNRSRRLPEKWDGKTAGRIVSILVAESQKCKSLAENSKRTTESAWSAATLGA